MMDLENVLPIGVQVTSIEPAISSDGNVMIRLRVSGERDRAVQLVRNLERSKRFLAPRLTGEASQTKEGAAQGSGNSNFNSANTNPNAPPAVEFEILADYNPLPAGETYATVKAARAAVSTDGAAGADAPRSRRHPSTKGDGVVLKPYSATHPNMMTRPNPTVGGPR
jgi:type IV pilus assembly protein PilN